ncbi:MAG: hypothetical protein JO287_02580 [Pseudonocardiales bacterium]|nr:hypothetical protein [Pseudonocardiales bacterium]
MGTALGCGAPARAHRTVGRRVGHLARRYALRGFDAVRRPASRLFRRQPHHCCLHRRQVSAASGGLHVAGRGSAALSPGDAAEGPGTGPENSIAEFAS